MTYFGLEVPRIQVLWDYLPLRAHCVLSERFRHEGVTCDESWPPLIAVRKSSLPRWYWGSIKYCLHLRKSVHLQLKKWCLRRKLAKRLLQAKRHTIASGFLYTTSNGGSLLASEPANFRPILFWPSTIARKIENRATIQHKGECKCHSRVIFPHHIRFSVLLM